MRCPYCDFIDSKVIDSRPSEDDRSIRRRRECLKCGRRFTTYEKVEEMLLTVVKKDGSREAFDRNKILNGIMRACEKRPVSREQMDNVVNDIERYLYSLMEKEISSSFIGDVLSDHLKALDEVAYVRFASVYRHFEDVSTFIAEIEKLHGGKPKKGAKSRKAAKKKENSENE